jgi:hypothetical protein
LSAEGCFEQAVAPDRNFARSFAGISDAPAFLSVLEHGRSRDGLPKARAAAERARELD